MNYQPNKVLQKKAKNLAKKVDKMVYNNTPVFIMKLPYWIQLLYFKLFTKLSYVRTNWKITYKYYVFWKLKETLEIRDF